MKQPKNSTYTNLLSYILTEKNPESSQELIHQTQKAIAEFRKENLQSEKFFLIGTTWVIRDGCLMAFTSQYEAKEFARRNELEDSSIYEATKDEVDKELSLLHSKKEVKRVTVYNVPPLGTSYTPEEFLGITQIEESNNGTQTNKTQGAVQWNGVIQMQEALDTYKKEDRRKIDNRLSCENVHTLIDYLMKENYLDATQMSESIGIPENVIREFCRDPRKNDYSKKIIVDLLSFFGLEKYLLAFKDQCNELRSELLMGQSGHEIDKYFLKKGSASTGELFQLTNLQRVSFKDTYCECFLYQATLVSELRPEPIRIRLTNPSPPNTGLKVPCIVDKYYAIEGLDEVDHKPANALEPKSKKFSQGRLDMLQEEKVIVISPAKVGRQSTLPKEEQFERQTIVLAHLKKEFNCTHDEAIQKAKRLHEVEKILEMYKNYALSGKSAAGTDPNRNNFHVKKLVQEMRYSFYDACDLMVSLHINAEKEVTLARLQAEYAQISKKKG